MNNQIKYYSTNLKSPEVSFSEALLKGLAPDGGLYLPSSLPVVSTAELESFSGEEYHEIAFTVLNKLIGDEIDEGYTGRSFVMMPTILMCLSKK